MGPEGYALIQSSLDEAGIAVKTSLMEDGRDAVRACHADDASAGHSLSATKVAQGTFSVEFVNITLLDGASPAFVLEALSKAGLIHEDSDGQRVTGPADKPSLIPVVTAPDRLSLKDINYPASE